MLGERDSALLLLGLPLNAAILESQPLTCLENCVLRQVCRALDARDADALDSVWRARLIRGLYSQSRLPEEERLAFTVDGFRNVGRWRRTCHSLLNDSRVAKARALTQPHIRMSVGGEDLYGHLVWVEQPCNLAAMLKLGITSEDLLLARADLTEAIERRKQLRYQQVYILDISTLCLALYLTDARARKLTDDLCKFCGRYYPEGTYQIYVVNAPLIFKSVYALLSPTLSAATRSKICILGGDYIKVLASRGVPATAIPKLLKGGQHPGFTAVDLVGEVTTRRRPCSYPCASRSVSSSSSSSASSCGTFAELDDDSLELLPPPRQRPPPPKEQKLKTEQNPCFLSSCGRRREPQRKSNQRVF